MSSSTPTARFAIVNDTQWMLDHLNSLTDTHEAGFVEPWKVSDAPADFIDTMMKGIIGFRNSDTPPRRQMERSARTGNERDREAVSSGLTQLATPRKLHHEKAGRRSAAIRQFVSLRPIHRLAPCPMDGI